MLISVVVTCLVENNASYFEFKKKKESRDEAQYNNIHTQMINPHGYPPENRMFRFPKLC